MSSRPIHLAASLLLFASLGCSVTRILQMSTESPATGNWQFSASDSAAAGLPSLSGELSGSGANITGTVHSNSATACISPSTAIALSGSADSTGLVTLTGANLAGGTLQVTGTLSPDSRSLTGATYTVTGGTCAFSSRVKANAQYYSPITGNYAGSFSDPGGQVIAITASLSQTPASDTTGNFQLTGTGTLGSNSCFTSPTAVTSSQVTGGSFTLTYSDPVLANSVTASGTFSADGTTLTITSWNLTGTCGPDSGTGILTKQ